MFCNQCGQQIPNDSRFCPVCGAPQGYVAPRGPVGTAPTAPPPAPAQPTTPEGWMLLAVRDAICKGLKDPFSARFGDFENIECDAYGRTYAEIVVYATNSYGAYVPTRYAVGFFDVSAYAPCMVIPNSLFMLPAVMVGAQRAVAKKMIKFGSPR